jgi:hypothetical protein
MRIAALVLLLIGSLGGFWAATAAHADDPPVVTLQALPPSGAAEGQTSVVLSARLLRDDAPVAGVPITFYVVTTVFGERLMKVGESLSDATGMSSVLYRPTWDGDHTARKTTRRLRRLFTSTYWRRNPCTSRRTSG